jgi:hypothetical protein
MLIFKIYGVYMERLRKHLDFTLFFLFFFLSAAVFAQETADELADGPPSSREEFFIAANGETLLYGRDHLAYGGGLTLGYGTGLSLGIKFLVAIDRESFFCTELLFFLRFYFLGVNAGSGPYIQLNGGPVIVSDSKPEVSNYGSISAGLTAGWRVPLGDSWFIEPFVRGGYPYMFGAGLSGGLRF